MEHIIIVIAIIGLIVMIVGVVLENKIKSKKRAKLPQAGFEPLSNNLYVGGAGFFYVKDDMVFYNKSKNPDKALPIDVMEVSEITRNTKLVQLEIRYRIEGAIRSERITGPSNALLEIEDKLGYGR